MATSVQMTRPAGSDWLKDRALSLSLAAIFLVCWIAQAIAGFHVFNHDRADHGLPAVTSMQFLRSGTPWESTFENWESEFLEMSVFVMLTVVVWQKGSAESRRPHAVELVDADPRDFREHPDAPWPVRRGGWILWIYERSLGLAFVALFLLSWVAHMLSGRAAEAAAQAVHGRPGPTLIEFMASSKFWFQSFQNWQSEFLGILAMVWLSVYLRQRGSPESKPVHAPHSETGR
jgi:hypothetical protein